MGNLEIASNNVAGKVFSQTPKKSIIYKFSGDGKSLVLF
jgi:hypothetical protein